jgi:C4-dicarboxylate-binding protein DctP
MTSKATPTPGQIVGGLAIVLALTLGALLLIRMQSVGAGEPILIKFSHVVAPDTPKGKAALYFKQLVEERSHGRVLVSVYPNSELYKDKEELEALQLGSVQMVAPSLAKLGPLGIKEFELFDIPFLFDSYESVHKVTDGPIGRELMRKFDSVGLLGLAFWDNGFKEMSADRPLLNPSDFRGLRMRIQSSEVLDAQMRALGAYPESMALSDVYSALSTGVVNGTENPASNFYTQRLYKVQPYLTLSDHGYLGYVVLVNSTFWDGLPRDARRILENSMRDVTQYENDIAKSENEADLARVRASGETHVIELTPSQRQAWRVALAGVKETFRKRVGSNLLDAVHSATARSN